MKNFMTKILFFVCSLIFFYGSFTLTRVYLGHYTLTEALVLYDYLLVTPHWLNAVLGVAAVFFYFGFAFLVMVQSRKRQPQAIIVRDKGELVRIPVATLADFIIQIVNQHAHFSDTDIKIHKKGKWIYIDLLCVMAGDMPMRSQIRQLKNALKEEIKRVFEFPFLKIDFQLEGIRVDEPGSHFASEPSLENIAEEDHLPTTEPFLETLSKEKEAEDLPEEEPAKQEPVLTDAVFAKRKVLVEKDAVEESPSPVKKPQKAMPWEH